MPNANGGSDAPTVKGSDEPADARDAGKSSADKSKLPLIFLAIVLAIAVIAGGFWALSGKSSNDSGGEDVGSLQAENARLNSDNDRIRELESDLEAVQTDKQTVTDQRDALIEAFGNLDPRFVTDFGTPGGAFWTGSPELVLGCAYIKEGNTTLVVTVASGTPTSYGEFIKNNGVRGLHGVVELRQHGRLCVDGGVGVGGLTESARDHGVAHHVPARRGASPIPLLVIRAPLAP